MPDIFRIHGDNIVECERIAHLILDEVHPDKYVVALRSPSTLVYKIEFEYQQEIFFWELHLLPGFNKARRRRWESDIFSALRANGSFLDETPDAIVTSMDPNNGLETIIYAIEFCSALQAGNQAWQRSGRAFSTGRTGCPYLYIVDFVKYELDPHSRMRINLRFPNAAVPYSYINFSNTTGNFVAQVYTRSEEFDKDTDPALRSFNEDDFADAELSAYMVKTMCGMNTSTEERIMLQKNLNVVMFLSRNVNANSNFTAAAWRRLSMYGDIIEYSRNHTDFGFHKIITGKGHHGNSKDFLELVEEHSIGLASSSLPFGLIPREKRSNFARALHRLYPSYDYETLQRIGDNRSDLIMCLIKGFKPHGDDNRPDRGILPLAAMLTSTDVEIMTYIYGPVISSNYDLLLTRPRTLAQRSGFWKSVLALSNYVALDVPIIRGNVTDARVLIDTSDLKNEYTDIASYDHDLTQPLFSSVPREYHEDDVDTGIHFIFDHLLNKYCFEGMCNPPGGDWSGLSIIDDCNVFRWLSLPRVSEQVDGKRPDHVLELFEVFDRPVLLAIESKERSSDLEPGVGNRLINYILNLMAYVPNVERHQDENWAWHRAEELVDPQDFKFISAAAYLRSFAEPDHKVFRNSDCDLLIIMDPIECETPNGTEYGWDVELVPRTATARRLKRFVSEKILESGFPYIIIH